MKTAFIFLILTVSVLYLKWWFTPPDDVVGSHLPGFDDPDRRRMMIKAEADQEITLGLGKE